MDQNLRPGYTTTEFWITLGGILLAFITAISALFDHAVPDTAKAVVATAAPLAAMIGAAYYAWSRAHVKAAVTMAKADLEVAKIGESQQIRAVELEDRRLQQQDDVNHRDLALREAQFEHHKTISAPTPPAPRKKTTKRAA